MRRKISTDDRWFRHVTDGSIGMVAWYRGDFADARAMLEEATAALAGANIIDYESAWFVPNESIASTHTHLALARFVQGDFGGAEEQFTATVRRVAEPRLPTRALQPCLRTLL